MTLTILDLIVIVVVLISATLAMVRGFAREVLSLASWVLAVAAAYYGYKPLVPLVKPYVESATIATVIAAAVIFFIALIVASYVTTKIADFIIDSRIGAFDRGLGFLFGAARGLLLLVIALLFFSWLVPKPPAWVAGARTQPMLTDLGQRLMAALPSDVESKIMKHLHNDTGTGGGDTAAPDDSAGAAAPDDSASPAPQSSEPTYGNSSRQNLDQLIQNSGN
jgi:membrane protein required for colicin V production